MAHLGFAAIAVTALLAMSVSPVWSQIVYTYSRSGQDWPGVCVTGTAQSPINIVSLNTVPALTARFNVQYEPLTNVTVVNTGHVIELEVPSTSNNTLRTERGDVLPLVNLHFHAYGEHSVNGIFSPLEAHYVHRNADGSRIAVIAVQFSFDPTNQDNAFLSQITRFGSSLGSTSACFPLQISLANLFYPPGSSRQALNYYSYSGSLTAPPCSETVLWSVLLQRQSVSTSQVITLLDAVSAVNAGVPINNRLAQPLNGRTVFLRTVI